MPRVRVINYPGRGYAESAAEALLGPAIHGAAKVYATAKVQRLYGFWMTWHAVGGYRAMLDAGFVKSGIHRQRNEFRDLFGVTVEDAWPELQAAVGGHFGAVAS